ncbi:LacI family DNA-binding transcriptional regulator [Clostridium estertheticum]|uniref:LacI family DNA-binding transcriptional regulator n=1 Tax=Clostridium estertheticum TaxID=238834 RepID=UPI001CF44DB3|nr:LacI family DNA-binding transcriptional regulator [Clostridium estertheticum]MCB2355162.1 LacI family transcriptional regulator [Clostridium estertheticum]WAG39455.1 LacI family transcriptional regulator [Clostridium estertheticum]
MSYTMYDLARDAGVSVATVSRVINKNGSVKEDTKQRILEIIKDKGYIPNAYARGMNNISMKTIGVIIADIVNPFFAEVVKGIEVACQKNGYKLILCSTANNADTEKKEIEMLVEKFVDGFIIVGSRPSNDNNASFLINLSNTHPIVLVNSFIKGGQKMFSILVDEGKAVYDTLSYFNPGNNLNTYILGDPTWKTTTVKINAFKIFFEKHNLDFSNNNIINCSHSYSGGKAAARELFERNLPYPYIVICSSDTIAIGALREFLKYGVKIPDQVSIMGFSNIEVSSLTTPSLSTIDQNLFELGQKSGHLFIDILHEKYPINKKTYSDYQLIIRESTLPKDI